MNGGETTDCICCVACIWTIPNSGSSCSTSKHIHLDPAEQVGNHLLLEVLRQGEA